MQTPLTLSSAGLVAGLSRLRTRTALLISGGTALSTLVLVQVPWIAYLFHMEPLHADDWLLVVVTGVAAAVAGALGSWGSGSGR